MYIKTIAITTILLFVFFLKTIDIPSIRNFKVTKILTNEYKNNYSYTQVNQMIIKVLKKTYKIVTPIIPEGFKQLSKNQNKTSDIKIYSEDRTYEKSINDGKGSFVEDIKQEITASSSLSSEDQVIEKIKDTKIQFVLPTKGIISSSFGDREEIFSGVGTYHTGVDIANKKGTEIYSSIPGTVTVADYNKYNGNYVEVTNGTVVTKYCHMEKRLVKVGEEVRAGTRIGLMGSTGLSTGPHLHFEIAYNGIKINPEKILEI